MAVYDAPAEELIKRIAQELEKEDSMKPPEWAPFVRTGAHKDRRPSQQDWWHVRSASILRKIFTKGPIGVSKLRIDYGGKKNRGMQPEKFYPASGNIIRKILQQLENTGLVKQGEKGAHKGRIITPKGHALLESAASAILKEKGIVLKEKPKIELPAAEKKPKKAVKKPKKKTVRKRPTKKKAEKTAEKTEEKKPEKSTEKEPEKKAETPPQQKEATEEQ